MSRLHYNTQAGSFNESSFIRKSVSLSAMRFARQVLKMTDLRKLWSHTSVPASSALIRIVYANSHYLSHVKPNINNVITPGGFTFQVYNATVENDRFSFEMPPLYTYTRISASEVTVSIHAVICFFTPLKKDDDLYRVTGVSYEIPKFNFRKPFKSIMPFNRSNKTIASRYADSILYLALVTKDAKGNIVKCSGTFSKQFRTERKVFN